MVNHNHWFVFSFLTKDIFCWNASPHLDYFLSTDAISAIVGCLDYGDPEIKSIVFNILEMVCYIHYVGPSLILEALTARVTKIAAPEATSSPSPSPKTNQKAPKKRKSRRLLKNADLIDWGQDFEKGGKSKSSGSLLPVPKKVTVNTKERFVPLVSPLSSVSMSPVNKRNCLYIINSILDSTSDLEERFLLRMEVTALGISNLLPDLPDECSDQRDQYEIDNVQDYQDMFDKFPKDHVNGLIAKAGGNTLGSLGENDGSRLDVLVCFPETFSRICTVPFDADKNWGDHRFDSFFSTQNRKFFQIMINFFLTDKKKTEMQLEKRWQLSGEKSMDFIIQMMG